jgi:hypothetical protein
MVSALLSPDCFSTTCVEFSAPPSGESRRCSEGRPVPACGHGIGLHITLRSEVLAGGRAKADPSTFGARDGAPTHAAPTSSQRVQVLCRFASSLAGVVGYR